MSITVFLQTQPATSAQPTATAQKADDEGFRNVEGGDAQTSGEVLLIQAYAAVWVVLFILVFMSIRKQRNLDDRIERLGEDLAKARDAGGK